MGKGLFHLLFKVSLLLSISLSAQGKVKSSKLTAINFQQVNNKSELEFVLDSNEVVANKFQVSEDKQIVIDLVNVESTERVMRAFDTSEFSGSIVFVSAYPKPGSSKDIRVVVQLRDNVRSIVKRKANSIVLEVENRFGIFNQEKVSAQEKQEQKLVKVKDEDEIGGKLLVPRSDSVEDILENLTLSGRKKYIGQRISLDIKDVNVSDILKMISEASGFNIILTENIKRLPPLTLNLTDVPWDQALDTILGLNKLVAKKNGIILLIQTLDVATKDKEDEARARSLAVRQEPLVTKVFPISYALTKDLSVILNEYVTPERGKISEDIRTNSLIIKDTPDIIEKIRRIIEVLDTQTPQVLIESKVVEVTEEYSKEIGLSQGVNFGYDPVGSLGNSLPTPVGSDTPTPGVDGGPGFSLSSAPGGAGDSIRNLFGLSIARFGRLTDLTFRLQLLEAESKGKIVSSPKVVTQNKKKATLRSRSTTTFSTVTGTGEDAQVSFEETEANLSLEVTPQVTNEGSIILDIALSKEDFGARSFPNAPPNKLGNDVNTSVLVENGSTIVLGGLYEYSKNEEVSGVPFLKDVPLLGWLFRTPYAPQTRKREVIIFLTPRIINQEEAGLVDQV